MDVKIHGPPKKVITPLTFTEAFANKQGLIDRYEMLSHRNARMKQQIKENELILKEIKEMIGTIDGITKRR